MDNFGIVKQIIISIDLFESMTESQREDIQNLLHINTSIFWLIKMEELNYYRFIYDVYPLEPYEK